MWTANRVTAVSLAAMATMQAGPRVTDILADDGPGVTTCGERTGGFSTILWKTA